MAQKENRRKVRAILAGGLVLGVGVAVTLAAWSDSEFATGTFGTGKFVLEGKSIVAEDFASHPESSAAILQFPLDSDQIAADQSIQAPFAVRLSAATTENATVKLGTKVPTPINGLSYEVYKTDAFGCDDLTTPFASGAFDGVDVTVPAFDLNRGDNGAGVAQNLCFVVKANANLEQGAASSAVWEFAATQKN